MTAQTAVRQPVRVVTYRGSIAHLNGQMMKVVDYDVRTDRFTLEAITGATLENVRRKSFIG